MFLWGGLAEEPLTKEDMLCLRDWENFQIFGKLPHELGYAEECYHEDVEAIKTMKRWIDKRQEREQKKKGKAESVRERMKARRSR